MTIERDREEAAFHSKMAWVMTAGTALSSDFGLPAALALAVAAKLYEREVVLLGAAGKLPDPLGVVQAHMDSDEAPLVDPDIEFPDAAPESF